MRWFEHLVFLALVVGLARPVGLYLARVFGAEKPRSIRSCARLRPCSTA